MPALKCHQAPSSSLPGACWRRERFGVPATPTCLLFSGCVSFLRAPSLKQEACGPTPPAQGSQEVAHKACGTPLGSENPRRLPLPAESPRRGWGRGTGQHVEGAEPRAAHSVPGGLSVGGPSSPTMPHYPEGTAPPLPADRAPNHSSLTREFRSEPKSDSFPCDSQRLVCSPVLGC